MTGGWPAIVLLTLAALVAVTPWVVGRPRPAGVRRRRRDSPGAPLDPAVLLDLLDIALASGAPIPRALTVLAESLGTDPLAAPLRTAGAALRLGATWPEAWSGSPAALGPVVVALEPAWTDGIDPGPIVRHHAARFRAQRQRESREAAARLGARLVLPLGLCFLPAFVLLSMVPVLLSGADVLLGH